MKFVLDTNILILLVKSSKFGQFFKRKYQLNYFDSCYVSHISLGELDSIVKQNNWGNQRTTSLNHILKGFRLVSSNSLDIIQNYGTIDAYSQGKLKHNPLPHGMSARNMGKNDLWIAATAMALQSTLISTDKDFSHLDKVFFEVDFIDIQAFI